MSLCGRELGCANSTVQAAQPSVVFSSSTKYGIGLRWMEKAQAYRQDAAVQQVQYTGPCFTSAKKHVYESSGLSTDTGNSYREQLAKVRFELHVTAVACR